MQVTNIFFFFHKKFFNVFFSVKELFGKDLRYMDMIVNIKIYHYIEDNQLVIFDMKNISRGCVVRR